MTHDHDAGNGQPFPDPTNGPVPAVDRPGRDVPVARQPMEQIGRAMQVQAELLKQMHERQRMLEDVVKDNRRHELMINSAQALNESFQGLQRVQERLADKLDDAGGGSRGRFTVLVLAIVLLAGVGGVVAWRIMAGADAITANLEAALDPKSRDRALHSDLAKLESRVRHVEEADRAAFRDEIESLRKGLTELTTENEKLRGERDGALKNLGATEASLSGIQTEVAELRERTVTLEKDNARLTTQGVADQKTIVQLNDLIAMMKAAKAPVSEPAVTAAAKEEARPAPVEPAAPPPPPALVPKAAGQPSGEQVAGASTPALLPFPDKGIATLNEMLKEHAGGDVYEIKKAEKVGGQKLWNVVMEVRGLDGRLTKTVEAESLVFWVDKDFLDLEFQVGSVTFHQGAAGRSTKSPFFNDRYTLPVLLKSGGGAGWLATNQPFVRPK